jgi:hypothetical protein
MISTRRRIYWASAANFSPAFGDRLDNHRQGR